MKCSCGKEVSKHTPGFAIMYYNNNDMHLLDVDYIGPFRTEKDAALRIEWALKDLSKVAKIENITDFKIVTEEVEEFIDGRKRVDTTMINHDWVTVDDKGKPQITSWEEEAID